MVKQLGRLPQPGPGILLTVDVAQVLDHKLRGRQHPSVELVSQNEEQVVGVHQSKPTQRRPGLLGEILVVDGTGSFAAHRPPRPNVEQTLLEKQDLNPLEGRQHSLKALGSCLHQPTFCAEPSASSPHRALLSVPAWSVPAWNSPVLVTLSRRSPHEAGNRRGRTRHTSQSLRGAHPLDHRGRSRAEVPIRGLVSTILHGRGAPFVPAHRDE
jgi:hypothetical protein